MDDRVCNLLHHARLLHWAWSIGMEGRGDGEADGNERGSGEMERRPVAGYANNKKVD